MDLPDLRVWCFRVLVRFDWAANTLFFLIQKQMDTPANRFRSCYAMLFTVRQQPGIGIPVKTYLQSKIERIFCLWPPCAWAHFITYFLHP